MKHLLALILFVWSALPFTCKGEPDVIVGYLAYDAEIVIARWDTCTMEDGTKYACPVYVRTGWTQRASLVSESYDWPAPDVGLGEVALLNIEQMDAAGNVSGACP